MSQQRCICSAEMIPRASNFGASLITECAVFNASCQLASSGNEIFANLVSKSFMLGFLQVNCSTALPQTWFHAFLTPGLTPRRLTYRVDGAARKFIGLRPIILVEGIPPASHRPIATGMHWQLNASRYIAPGDHGRTCVGSSQKLSKLWSSGSLDALVIAASSLGASIQIAPPGRVIRISSHTNATGS